MGSMAEEDGRKGDVGSNVILVSQGDERYTF